MNASNVGDISTDDNAVDLPIKSGEEGTGIGLSNANDRIPILDDDDDVIVLPQEEPVITEIPDDDDHEAKDEASKQMPNSQGAAAENRDTDLVAMSQDTGVVSQSDSEKGQADANDEGSLNFIRFIIEIITIAKNYLKPLRLHDCSSLDTESKK